MAPIRFSIHRKIVLSCLLLSGSILFFAYFFSRLTAERAADPARLAQHLLRRYEISEAGLATATLSIAQQLSTEADLRRALEKPYGAGASASAPAETSQGAVQSFVDGVRKSLDSEHGLRPDLFVIEDMNGHLWNGGVADEIHAEDVLYSSFLTRIRATAVAHAYLFPDHGGFIASGVPIFGLDGRHVVGAVAICMNADRWFSHFSEASADEPAERQHVVLLRPDHTVAASSLPRDKDEDIAGALATESLRTRWIADRRVDEARLLGQTYFIATDHPPSFGGGTDGTVSPASLIVLLPEEKDDSLQRAYAIAFGLAIAAAFLVSWLLGRLVTRPIERFIAATDDILAGEGDLSKRVAISSRDELGALGQNLNRLFDNLQRLALEVQSASGQVGASASEIRGASKEMLEGAKDQALRIESSTAAVTQLSSSIQKVAENALQATKIAEESNSKVGAAIERMAQIRAIVEDASGKIHELGESGKRIGNIVEVIRQISEQTSLLALNASIEAAHAGEQGRGFAVVADEVSSLARRVGQSAKDIEDLIATIKEQTTDAVETMRQGTKEVEDGTSLVGTTLGNLKSILAMVQDTAHAVQEQAVASDEIARNMDAVQKIAHAVLTSSEEAVIQAEQLRALADALEESVSGFRTSGEEPPAARSGRPGASGREGGGRLAPESLQRLLGSSRAALSARDRSRATSTARGSSGSQGVRS